MTKNTENGKVLSFQFPVRLHNGDAETCF